MKTVNMFLSLVLGIVLASHAYGSELDKKIHQLTALENVEFLSLRQAGTVFDLDGWAYRAQGMGFHDGVALAYVANFFADQMRLAATKKNSLLDEPWSRLAFIGRKVEWQNMRDAELTVKKLKPRYEGAYVYVDIQVYPELNPRTDSRADATVIFRRARTGLKVYDIKAQGISVLNLALASISSQERSQLGSALVKHGSVSRAQVQAFKKLRF